MRRRCLGEPLPAKPLDIWLAGSAPAGLRRVGRLGDGWLGSLLTPAEAGEAVAVIKAAADEAGLRRIGRLADGWLGSLLTPAEARAAIGVINAAAGQAAREVEQDHFGISLPVAFGGIPDALAASIRRRRADADPASLIADGWAGARDLISAFVDAGLTKFVIRPAATPGSFEGFIDGFASNLMPLQT